VTKLENRVVKVMVAPKGEHLYSELVTFVEIADESAGEFVKVSQPITNKSAEFAIFINKDEWPSIRDAIDNMIKECREECED
jgi:hypothetical protein